MTTRWTRYPVFLVAYLLLVSACAEVSDSPVADRILPALFQRDKTATVIATIPDSTTSEGSVRESAELARLQCGNVPLTITGAR